MKNLGKKGLSMTDAQTVSNTLNQKCIDLKAQLNAQNNCSKTITVDGHVHIYEQGNPIQDNILDVLEQIGEYHAAQSFLMENIKAKADMLKTLKDEKFSYTIVPPIKAHVQYPTLENEVDDKWGWSQLTKEEYNTYLYNEAKAAHIGQYISANSKLAKLRNELPSIKGLEWFEVENGKKTPIVVKTHHTPEQLSEFHEKLSLVHREYEKEVNYFKAKVKNLVSLENARIAHANSALMDSYNKEVSNANTKYLSEMEEWNNNKNHFLSEKEAQRHERVKEVSEYRIQVDSNFKATIDKFLTKVD